MSVPRTASPSRCAAVAITAEAVITPVPPTPEMRMFHGCLLSSALSGTGSSAVASIGGTSRFSSTATTVVKAGQSPDKHERSVLQLVWSTRVLRPNCVSTGCRDRQPDFSPQSPQPSQMRSLITIFSVAWARWLRLRARRFSAAHSWSWISTETPCSTSSSFCTSARSSRGHTCTPEPRRARRVRRTSSLVTTILAGFSARTMSTSPARLGCPTGSWPPVIATVPLCSSLRVAFTLDATIARSASDPECRNVPSPMFCTKCSSDTKLCIPIQCAPSPPICAVPMILPTRLSSISITMAWQPIPAPTSVSSSARVDRLCGQPEQKCGTRLGTASGREIRVGPLVTPATSIPSLRRSLGSCFSGSFTCSIAGRTGRS